MKAHPLFCGADADDERRSRDIGFIQVHRIREGKRLALPFHLDAEQLQTLEDLRRVTGVGTFELIGRESREGKPHRILDRVLITLDDEAGK